MRARDPDERAAELLHASQAPSAGDLAAVFAAQHPRIDRRWQLLGAMTLVSASLLWWRGCQTVPTPTAPHTAVVMMPGEASSRLQNLSRAAAEGVDLRRGQEPMIQAPLPTFRPQQQIHSTSSPRTPSQASIDGQTSKLDINSATAADLDALPGIGPVLAQRVLAWRSEHGQFSDAHELLEVKGIGPAKFARISPRIRIR